MIAATTNYFTLKELELLRDSSVGKDVVSCFHYEVLGTIQKAWIEDDRVLKVETDVPCPDMALSPNHSKYDIINYAQTYCPVDSGLTRGNDVIH